MPTCFTNFQTFCLSLKRRSFFCCSNLFKCMFLCGWKHWQAESGRLLVQDLSQLMVLRISSGDRMVKVWKCPKPGGTKGPNLRPQAHQVSKPHEIIFTKSVPSPISRIFNDGSWFLKLHSDAGEEVGLGFFRHRKAPVQSNRGLVGCWYKAAIWNWKQIHGWFQKQPAQNTESFAPRTKTERCIPHADHHLLSCPFARLLKPVFDGILFLGVKQKAASTRLVLRKMQGGHVLCISVEETRIKLVVSKSVLLFTLAWSLPKKHRIPFPCNRKQKSQEDNSQE